MENNAIVGEVTAQAPLKTIHFLIYDKEVGDFELTAEFKITESGNTNSIPRSELFPGIPYALKGYPEAISMAKNVYTGLNYRRTWPRIFSKTRAK